MIKPTPRIIAIIVGVIYLSLSMFIFRGVIASIPSVLRGEAVIAADELVPFFNPTSQLFDQAAGNFNELTNGYEFRVRYAMLTTWMRYYKVLPFAIVLVNPFIAYAAYLVVAGFLRRILPQFRAQKIYIISASPVLVFFLILMYAKITHFYTLILGFSLFLIAIVLMTYGLIFPQKQPYKPIIIACILTLLNPAVHYLVLFGLYMALSVLIMILLDAWSVYQSGVWKQALHLQYWCQIWTQYRTEWRSLLVENRFWRCVGAFLVLGLFTLAPYGAFVKFYALKGVANLSETVPADYYFIVDASVSLAHLISMDMAGIMDKFTTGDYLSKIPRWSNLVYFFLLFTPWWVKRIRRDIFNTPELQTFGIIIYANTLFSMWATLGYTSPDWLPTFHRTIAFLSNFAFGTRTLPGDLIVLLFGTVVQVLRFPHRFEFILFATACIMIPIPLIWLEHLGSIVIQKYTSPDPHPPGNTRFKMMRFKNIIQEKFRLDIIPPTMHIFRNNLSLLPICIAVITLLPLLSNTAYSSTFISGNFKNFLAPYSVEPLQQLKEVLLQLPTGKVVVLPPTETAKDIVDLQGIDHKFIDKFYIYYIDLPSYYYGLTGDSNNKHEFFLLLRAMYYQQGWWVNIARDLGIRYIVVNKGMAANAVGGQEYLRDVELIIKPELEKRSTYVKLMFENESFALYQFTDLPTAERVPLFIDTDWPTFIQILSSDLSLTRYYDLRYTMVAGDLVSFDQLALVTDDEHGAALDLLVKANPKIYFRPSSTIMPFSPNLISSSYYLSPMFRLFQFFSNNMWNRLNMITPGLWGTIDGGFIGVPRATQFRIDVTIPEDGSYHLLFRGAVTSNILRVQSRLFPEPLLLNLHSDSNHLAYFDKDLVFATKRVPMDISQYSQSEIQSLIPESVIAINSKYQYIDLTTIHASKGKYTLYFDKQDSAPLIVEGLVVIPQTEYETLALPDNVQVLTAGDLCCGPLIQDLQK